MLKKIKMNFGNIKVLDDIIKKSKEEQKSKSNNKFHQIIEKDKEFILNCFRKEPYYKDSISLMEKASKGTLAYRRMVKNGLKNKSSFIKVILKSIEKVNRDKNGKIKKIQPKIRKLKYGFCKSEIDILRKKRKEVENRIRLKSLELQKKEDSEKKYFSSNENNDKKLNSLLTAGKNIIDPLDINLSTNKNISRINSGNTRIFSGITKNLDNISTKNKSLTRSISTSSFITKRTNNNDNDNNNKNKIDNNFPENKMIKFNSILSKCKEEITHGKRIGGKVEKFTNNVNEDINLCKQNRNNKEDNNIQDQKIIEDKITNKQKYKLLEIEKFNKLKKSIDAKISDNYVYFNRKEYAEMVKEKRNDEEYDLYLEDINKINENLEKKKIKEKEKLFEIENLLDDVYKKKRYLKNKINNYSYNRIIEKEYEQYMKENVVFDDEFFILDNKKPEETKGTLIPRLLEKKDEFSKKKKIINEKGK